MPNQNSLSNVQSLYVDENISLEPPFSQYACQLFEVIDFNRDYFNQFMVWPSFVNNQSNTVDFLDNCLKNHLADISKTYIISFKKNPIGILSFNHIDQTNKTVYIGYWLDSRLQDKGIVTHSINAIIKYYSLNLTIKRFVIKCSVHNIKSNNVAKRCGFFLEGTLKQAEYLNGTFHDQHIYSFISPYI